MFHFRFVLFAWALCIVGVVVVRCFRRFYPLYLPAGTGAGVAAVAAAAIAVWCSSFCCHYSNNGSKETSTV